MSTRFFALGKETTACFQLPVCIMPVTYLLSREQVHEILRDFILSAVCCLPDNNNKIFDLIVLRLTRMYSTDHILQCWAFRVIAFA